MPYEQVSSDLKLPLKPQGLLPATPTNISEFVSVRTGAIVSRQVIKSSNANVTLFAIDEGEGLSEHTSPYDALVQIVEGEAEITVQGKTHHLVQGEMILLPADHVHSLYAIRAFKMMLTMVRS